MQNSRHIYSFTVTNRILSFIAMQLSLKQKHEILFFKEQGNTVLQVSKKMKVSRITFTKSLSKQKKKDQFSFKSERS